MRFPTALLALGLIGCGQDYSLGSVCIADDSGFDIDEVSRLQDAAGYPDSRDAIVLDYDPGDLQAGESWRVTRVDLLAMVPEWVFDRYDGGDVLR